MQKPSNVVKFFASILLLALAACGDDWEVEPYDYTHGDRVPYSTGKINGHDYGADGMVVTRKITLPKRAPDGRPL